MKTVTPARGIRGHLLYDPITGKTIFRVYETNESHTDYTLSAESIAIELLSNYNCLVKEDECLVEEDGIKNYISFTSSHSLDATPPL